MTACRLRLTLAAIALAVTCGCGAESEAQTAAGRLAAALSEPDAAALRELVGSESTAGRTDLLTDEVVAENAFAGHRVDIAADTDRFNGYGTFTLTSPDAPGTEVTVQQRLTETRTPAGLETVAVSLGRTVDTLLVNDHRIEVVGDARKPDPGRAGPRRSTFLPARGPSTCRRTRTPTPSRRPSRCATRAHPTPSCCARS